MQDITLILLAAGSSSRFKSGVKKQWIRTGNEPLWQFVTKSFTDLNLFEKIIVVSSADECNYMRAHDSGAVIVEGSDSRQSSLKNALLSVETTYVMVSDIARACVDRELIERLINSKERADVTAPVIRVNDTAVYNGNTIDREELLLIQTPQLSRSKKLRDALQSDTIYTDESSAIVAHGGTRVFVDGDIRAHKITQVCDLLKLQCLQETSTATLCGNGFDTHAFGAGDSFKLCGIKIDHNRSLVAHSDGDVAIHALIDALLGAAGAGDIGEMFPDTDSAYADMDSTILLDMVVKKLRGYGFSVTNADITIMAQSPKLLPYKEQMRLSVSKHLQIAPIRVNIKATTTEELGFIGRKEGIAVMATATLNYIDWTTL